MLSQFSKLAMKKCCIASGERRGKLILSGMFGLPPGEVAWVRSSEGLPDAVELFAA